MLSVFIRDPQFQGQTKDKLTSNKAIRLVESAVKDSFDHWLTSDVENATALLEYVIERAEARKKKKRRKSKTAKHRPNGSVFPENWPTVRRRRLTILKFSSSKETRPAVPPNKAATALPRPFFPCAAKF